MNNKLNNRNIFSVKLFWQSFLQLKIIGIISTAIMICITALPIIMDGIYINNMIKANKNAVASGVAIANNSFDYTSIVSPVSSASYLLIVIALITPILCLYAWFFLNKRSTSDFYHSLSYKRQNLFLSRFAAITAWQIIIMLSTYVTGFICYHIFSKYFIVDYSTTFHVYAAEFLCALLCSAAIALACSVTGNIFSNICLSGIIIFLPRFILILVNSTVSNIYAAASSTHFMPLLDNSYNMLTGQFLSIFEPAYFSSDYLSNMLLSGVSNTYTLMLAIIYAVIACALFTIRKSETAGKPALSWKLQFAIRCVIGFTISIFGTFVYVQMSKEDYSYGTSPYMYTIIAFIIAAIVVIVYELISSKKLHRVLNAVPSIIVAYVLAIICGFLLNAGINNMTSYRANADNIDYITLSVENRYYRSEYPDYFENVIKNIKINDKNTIKLIADIYNDNAEQLDNFNEQLYYTRSSVNYVTYEVYFKDGILGRYRKVFLKESDVNKLASALTKNEDFCSEYKNLPSYEDANITFSDYISEDKTRDIYNIMLKEIKSMPFSDWYQLVSQTSNHSGGDVSYVTAVFSRNGTTYSASFYLSSLMPESVNAYYNAANKTCADNNPQTFNRMKNALTNIINDSNEASNVSSKAHTNTASNAASSALSNTSSNAAYSMYVSVYSLDSTEYSSLIYNNFNNKELAKAILKELENPFEKNFDSTKPVIEIRYYDDDNSGSYSYYVQPAGYEHMSDYPEYEENLQY